MDLLQILLLGLVQAITEWLPLSSKTMDAALYLQVFGGNPNNLVSVLLALHFGTLCAAAIYFRKDVAVLAREFFARPLDARRKLGGKAGFFIAALLLTGIVGLPLLLLGKLVLPNLEAGALLS